jgi:hypothetical protein
MGYVSQQAALFGDAPGSLNVNIGRLENNQSKSKHSAASSPA